MIRRGFTLLEVMVALTVTGVVVTLSYTAMRAGLDTSQRIEEHRAAGEAGVAFRALVIDALRHAQPGVIGGPAVFFHRDRTGADGGAADSVAFATRGIEEPAGASAVWVASIWRDGDRVLFVAECGQRIPVSAAFSGITSFDLQTLGRGPGALWERQWSDASIAPQAVRLILRGGVESIADVPIVVRTTDGGLP